MDYVTCVELFIDLKPQIGWISFWAKIRCSEVFEVTRFCAQSSII